MQDRFGKNKGPTTCRMCEAGVETVGHVLSACPMLTWGAYKDRHDRVLYQLVRTMLEALQIKIPAEYRGPGGVAVPGTLGTKEVVIAVDTPVMTARPLVDTRPDLYVRMMRYKKILIFDVACTWEKSIVVRRPPI